MTCSGCSHPTICRVQGCAVPEAKRNKAAALITKGNSTMNQNDTDAIIGTLESIADSLETLTRIAVHMAAQAGIPAEVLTSPESELPGSVKG